MPAVITRERLAALDMKEIVQALSSPGVRPLGNAVIQARHLGRLTSLRCSASAGLHRFHSWPVGSFPRVKSHFRNLQTAFETVFECVVLLGLTPYFSRHLALFGDMRTWVSDSISHEFVQTTIMELVLWQVSELIACVLSTERYSPCETRAF